MEFTFSGKETKIAAQKFCSGRNHFYFIKNLEYYETQ